MVKEADEVRAIKIWRVSAWSIAITIFIGAIFAVISVVCSRQFQALQEETERYIQCEDATREIQDSASYLAEQVRLYAETGMRSHMDNYITEIGTTQRSQNDYDYHTLVKVSQMAGLYGIIGFHEAGEGCCSGVQPHHVLLNLKL